MWLASRRTNFHFPITVYLAIATCLIIISFTDLRALVFEAGLLGVPTVAYYVSLVINQI